jgi:hypothetical protein
MYAVEVDTGNRHWISEKNLHINYIQPPERDEFSAFTA